MPCLLHKVPQQKKAPVVQINQEVLHNDYSVRSEHALKRVQRMPTAV